METPDAATVQALRSDLALQIARHLQRQGLSQVAAAKALAVPQPTLSKIVNGRVSDLSLELLIRIAVRAGLPVVLQTGKEPAEAGAFVTGVATPHRVPKSRLADEARDAVAQSARRLTPEQRLEAHLKHSELVMALHNAGHTHAAGKSARAGRRSR
jgi:predicted XRE-type DNA-binding protein